MQWRSSKGSNIFSLWSALLSLYVSLWFKNFYFLITEPTSTRLESEYDMRNGKDLCSMIYESCWGIDGPEFIFLFVFIFLYLFTFIFIFMFIFLLIFIFVFLFIFIFRFIFTCMFIFIFVYIPVDRIVQMAGLRQKQGFLSTYSSDLKGRLPPK